MEHSLEYYRQAAADSDDSDCDILMINPVFQSKKKPKQHKTDSPSSVVSLSQSSLESNASTPSQQTASAKPALTEEQIEAKGTVIRSLGSVLIVSIHKASHSQSLTLPLPSYLAAQERIKDLKYPGLGDTNRTDQLGWHKAPKKKRAKENILYPCRLCKPDEKIGLIQGSSKGTMLVRYLGYQSDTTQLYGEIKQKQYIPLTVENKEIGMSAYMTHLKKYFKDNAVGLKAEVLAVRDMWRIVQEREAMSIATAESSTKKATKKPSQPYMPRKANLNRSLSSCGESSDEGSSDSDLDLDNTDKRTASKTNKLRAGDVIEYYDPIGVAGKPQWLKNAVILGVVAKGTFPLNLDSGDMLDRRSRIKRVRRLLRNKLVACHDAAFKDMCDYGFTTSGTEEMIGIKAKVEKAKQIRKDFDAGAQRFWESDAQQSNEESKAIKSSNAAGLLQHRPPPSLAKEESHPSLPPPLAQRNRNSYREKPKRSSPRIQKSQI
ncbi:MAG: hypothetical protein SGBAC_000581 [Bacillariaceae sp.]